VLVVLQKREVWGDVSASFEREEFLSRGKDSTPLKGEGGGTVGSLGKKMRRNSVTGTVGVL
jgi:hypothetical protein